MNEQALTALLHGVAVCECRGVLPAVVRGVTDDSRAVTPGTLFAAVPGATQDGRAFAADAVRRGAVAVVTESALPLDVPQVIVPNARVAIGALAAAWHGHPSRALRVVGVTGTSGKTTLTYLLEAIWQAMGRAVGVIGTVNNRFAGVLDAAPTTTPGPCAVQALLARMLAAGVTDVAMEVSSHALEQLRVDAVHFDGAVLTNLTHEHLDYHGSMEQYAAAKRRLFTAVLGASEKSARFIAANADDTASAALVRDAAAPVTWYGVAPAAAIRATEWAPTARGMRITCVGYDDAPLAFETALIGRFNVSNILAALSAARAMAIPRAVVVQALERIAPVPGRMEVVARWRGATVVVDYAHKPDALRQVLQAARGLAAGRVIAVFGCGGDRDRAKRSQMGAIAASDSDVTIITNDNPRTESPEQIAAAIVAGMGARAPQVELDRRAAIRLALQQAQAGDVVVIAGKGHETYQIIGTATTHFDDRAVVRELIAEELCN